MPGRRYSPRMLKLPQYLHVGWFISAVWSAIRPSLPLWLDLFVIIILLLFHCHILSCVLYINFSLLSLVVYSFSLFSFILFLLLVDYYCFCCYCWHFTSYLRVNFTLLFSYFFFFLPSCVKFCCWFSDYFTFFVCLRHFLTADESVINTHKKTQIYLTGHFILCKHLHFSFSSHRQLSLFLFTSCVPFTSLIILLANFAMAWDWLDYFFLIHLLHCLSISLPIVSMIIFLTFFLHFYFWWAPFCSGYVLGEGGKFAFSFFSR